MGLFGGGNSSSTSNNYDYNTYNAFDNRLALGDGAVGASGGSTAINAPQDNRIFSNTDSRQDNRVFSSTSNMVDPGALRAMEAAITSNTAATQSAIASANSSAAAAAAAASKASADAIASANASQRSALDFATGANATNAAGFSQLLDTGLEMFTLAGDSIRSATTDAFNLVDATNSGIAGAYQTATAEKSGSLDNKTIMILGLAAAAAVALFAFKKG